jgi:hypothetical protein
MLLIFRVRNTTPTVPQILQISRSHLKILGSIRVTQKTNKYRRQRIEFGHPGCEHPQTYPEDGNSRFLEDAGKHMDEYKAF